MRFLLNVLFALLTISSIKAQDNSFPSNSEDLRFSGLTSQAVGGLKGGINYIFGRAADRYGISDRDIAVTKINQAQKWEDNGGDYYFFDVEAENPDAWINSTYNIRALDEGEFRLVRKWRYTIAEKSNNEGELSDSNDDNETELPNPDTNVELEVEFIEEDENTCKEGEEVDSSEIDSDEELRDGLTYGIKWIFEKAYDNFEIVSSEIVVRHIDKICRWEKDGDRYFYFEAKAINADGDIFDAKFNVQQREDGDLKVVNEWRYNIEYADENKEDQNDSETESELNDRNPEEEISVEAEYDPGNDIDDE